MSVSVDDSEGLSVPVAVADADTPRDRLIVGVSDDVASALGDTVASADVEPDAPRLPELDGVSEPDAVKLTDMVVVAVLVGVVPRDSERVGVVDAVSDADAVWVGVCDGEGVDVVGVGVCVCEGVCEGERVSVGVTDGVPVPVKVKVGVAVGEAVCDQDVVTDCVMLAVRVCVSVPEDEGVGAVTDAVKDFVREGVDTAVFEGVTAEVGVFDGVPDLEKGVRVPVGDNVGAAVADGVQMPCTRRMSWFCLSATKTLPLLSAAMPVGELNVPSAPVPSFRPAAVAPAPPATVDTPAFHSAMARMRLLLASAT